MRILRTESGLTLVEVLAAVALFTIAVMLFVQLSDSDLLASKKSKKMNEAVRIADNISNTIRTDLAGNGDALAPNHPLRTEQFTCNNTLQHPFCQSLPNGYALSIHNEPYDADATNNDAANPGQQPANKTSASSLVHYNDDLTLVVVTVEWGL